MHLPFQTTFGANGNKHESDFNRRKLREQTSNLKTPFPLLAPVRKIMHQLFEKASNLTEIIIGAPLKCIGIKAGLD